MKNIFVTKESFFLCIDGHPFLHIHLPEMVREQLMKYLIFLGLEGRRWEDVWLETDTAFIKINGVFEIDNSRP